jgi:hypothetical protein
VTVVRPPAPAPQVLARQPTGTRTLARAADTGGGGGGGFGGGGSDSGALYDEVLSRVREEQEQLGQLIPHPF